MDRRRITTSVNQTLRRTKISASFELYPMIVLLRTRHRVWNSSMAAFDTDMRFLSEATTVCKSLLKVVYALSDFPRSTRKLIGIGREWPFLRCLM